MRRIFSPLLALAMAAIMLAAIPAAFAAAPSRLPFHDAPPPSEPQPSPPPSEPQPSPPPVAPAPVADIPSVPDQPAPPIVDVVRPPVGQVDVVELDRPAIDHQVKLRCVGSVSDLAAGVDLPAGTVECKWIARESLEVASWQLWNVEVRPEHGERNLVAELRPDQTSYVDRAVEVPGHYLYSVLGLNTGGEIIARSAVAPVNLVNSPVDHGALRLKCRPAASIDRGPAVDRAHSVGCEWSASQSEDAVGYVMWRIVDDGDRVMIARTGLDVRTLIDTEVSAGHRYTYVITAVDASGEVVGRSRPEHVGFPGPKPGPEPRPVPVPVPGPEPHPLPKAGTPAPRVDSHAPAGIGHGG